MPRLDRFLLGNLLAAALCAPACGADSTTDAVASADSGPVASAASPQVLRWVGAVEDTDVRLAALVGRGKARLFFCGGSESYASSTRWLDIDFNSEHLEFEDASWHIHAHLLQGLSGEVERAGDRERSFSARQYPASTLTGLYEGKASCGRIGLIVTQPTEHDMPSAQGACTGAVGEPAQQVTLVEALGSEKGKIRVQTQSGESPVLQLAELDSRLGEQ